MPSDKGKDYEKYRKIYAREGSLKKKAFKSALPYGANEELDEKWDWYGHAAEGMHDVIAIGTMEPPPQNILDVGCGWNEWKHLSRATWVRQHRQWPDKDLLAMSRIDIVGVDIACPGADLIAPAHNIPLKDKCVDLLVSFDCMEHIPEEEVSKSIKEFTRVAHRCYINVCLADSPTTIDDEPLHVCIKPKEWWVKKFKEHWADVKVIREVNQDTPHWTITVMAANVPINKS